MSMLTVYLFVMMDKFIGGFAIFAGASAVGFIISAMIRSDHRSDEAVYRRWGRWVLTLGIAMCTFTTLAILTPNTKQFAAIYMIPKVVNNEDIQAMSGDAMKAMRHKFGQWLDSIDPVEEIKEIVAPKEN